MILPEGEGSPFPDKRGPAVEGARHVSRDFSERAKQGLAPSAYDNPTPIAGEAVAARADPPYSSIEQAVFSGSLRCLRAAGE